MTVDVVLSVPLDRTFTYIWPVDRSETPEIGMLVRVPFGRRKMIGMIVGIDKHDGESKLSPDIVLKTVQDILPPEYHIDKQRLELARWMADYYVAPLGTVVPLMYPPAPGTKARGKRRVDAEFPLHDNQTINLTDEQVRALAFVEQRQSDQAYATLLLHGITGSGKTEVYLRAIEKTLARGKGALLLLPEIALTPQTEARVKKHLGEDVATLHSGLSAGERSRVHEAAARGEIRVIVGSRSAVFAPVRDLGLVVIDEEHESSFKQDDRPRYHARHVALMRARTAKAVVILGSATPDMESWHNAQKGLYELVQLSSRPSGHLPNVEIEDMRGDYAADGFSPRLLEAMETTLDAGRQVILYYNRRGYARVMQCSACGEAVSCPHCDIGLTVHLRPRRLLCHYCGFSRDNPRDCPDCGHPEFLPSGSGTEKIEIGLQAHFPDLKILRLDRDTTGRRGSHADILAEFSQGKAQVLIGTQMVAKGHHFPDVQLVGVLAADDGLHLPDYRAQERVMQLLTQVAGRTGRVDPGLVIFQTWQPEHPVIQAAAGHDYQGFSALELEMRSRLNYPPERRLLRLGVSARVLGEVSDAAQVLTDLLRSGLDAANFEVLGPAPAVFPRLRNRYRFQILVKGNLSVNQKAWLADCIAVMKDKNRNIDVIPDFDPAGIY
jgi:primosomal protein N' (replication factor Y) (superfamily II helicase)